MSEGSRRCLGSSGRTASSQSDLSPLVTQIDEHEQPEKTNLSPQPWEPEADTAPSPESLGPGTDTALSPQSTIALPQSLEPGTASALGPQSTVALCEKIGKLVLRVEEEMNAKLLQGELPHVHRAAIQTFDRSVFLQLREWEVRVR